MIPRNARRVVEVGCMHGAMARAYRAINPGVHYIGVDIDPDYAAVAAQACSQALAGDIEDFDDAMLQKLFPSDCWVFGDCLEHLRDPWRIVKLVRDGIDADGCLVACIPNAQHWTVQMRLASGQFRYEDSGLLDRTHVRWFTRITIFEMFLEANWAIDAAFIRQTSPAPPPALMAGIRAVAEAAGTDPALAEADANVFQYMLRVKPA